MIKEIWIIDFQEENCLISIYQDSLPISIVRTAYLPVLLLFGFFQSQTYPLDSFEWNNNNNNR